LRILYIYIYIFFVIIKEREREREREREGKRALDITVSVRDTLCRYTMLVSPIDCESLVKWNEFMSDYVNFKPFCSDLDVNLDLRSLSLVRAHEIVPCMYVCVCVCVCVCVFHP